MRNLPLYQATQGIKFAELDFPNGGLWFEKFFSDFNSNFSDIEKEKQMNNDIVQPKVMPSDQVLEKYVDRQKKLVSSQAGLTKAFKNQWHFVTGMGQNHPIENGFAWHPLLGVPYLAASGIKGVLRHWVKYYLEDKALEQKWFGSDDDKNPYAGELVFFDALPVDKPKIIVDVMTPHYGTWYQEGSAGKVKDAPHDSHEPVPIPFLVVEKATFAFSIAPRIKTDDSNATIEHAFRELTIALEFLGAGAKTGTGYGRFEQTMTAAERYEENRRIAKADLEAKERQRERDLEKQRQELLANRSPTEVLIEDTFKGVVNRQAINLLEESPSLWQSLSDEDQDYLAQKIKISDYYSGLNSKVRKKVRSKLGDLAKKIT